MGMANPAGRAGKIWFKASSAPAEPPTTIALMPLMTDPSCALVDAIFPHELDERCRVRGEAQCFLETEPEKALATQRIAQHPDRPILQLALEVDEHIAARRELHLRERAVGGQA